MGITARYRLYRVAVTLAVAAIGLSGGPQGARSVLAADAKPAADRKLSRAAVESLLDIGWSRTLKARRAADAFYQQAIRKGYSSPSLRYAYLLVLIRQRRYPDALREVERRLRTTPRDARLLRAQIWLSVITKKYDAALVGAERLAKQLSAAGGLPLARKLDAARFLGRITGYLEGPVRRAAPPEGIARFLREAILPRELAVQFATDRAALLKRYSGLTDERDRSIAAATARAELEKQRRLKELADERKSLAKRKETVQANQDNLESTLRRKLDELNSRLQPLNNEQSRIDAQGATVNIELSSIASEIRFLERQLDRIRDPLLRDRYIREIARLDRIASQYEFDAIALEGRAAVVNNQRLRVAGEGQAVRQQIGTRLNRTQRELDDLQKQEKRNRNLDRRARRPNRAISRKARVLATQARALTTYEPFPLEREKLELLDRLRAR